MTGVLLRGEETCGHTVRISSDNRGRDCSHAAKAKEHKGLPATPEAKEKAWNRLTPRAFRDSMALLTP